MPYDDGLVAVYAKAHKFESVDQFAAQVGAHRSHIGRVIRGERRSKKLLARIARAVGRSPQTVARHFSELRNRKHAKYKNKFAGDTP